MYFLNIYCLIFQIKSPLEFWSWVSNDFITKFAKQSFYNGKSFENMNLYMKDYASILIGYPILRQIRVKNSKYQQIAFLNS